MQLRQTMAFLLSTSSMNFLAHLYLGRSTPALMVGNYAADFLKHEHLVSLPPDVLRGVVLHRAIDSYTDQHEAVRACVHRLRDTQRKYAPVVSDILFDHLLCRRWAYYSPELELRAFADYCYRVLTTAAPTLPEHVQRRLASMVRHDWLMGYCSLDGLSYVLQRMDERTKYPSSMVLLTQRLRRPDELGFFEEHFEIFFKDLVAYVDHWLQS